MIIYNIFGKAGSGRLGNNFFELASMIGMSRKYECNFEIPKWRYSEYLMYPPFEYAEEPICDISIQEPNFHYEPEFWNNHSEDFKNKVVNIRGWLQSPKFWENDQKYIQERLSFTHELQNKVREQFIDVFTKPTIAISIRRGDFVNNENHYLLPIEYYIGALYQNFADFNNYNIVIFSDDLSYCKVHFECLENAIFADGLSDIEQLCLMSMMDNFIIANSTFSWWGAYLGEKAYSKIVRPIHHFAGNQLINCDIKDHYPENWIVYDHLDTKIDLPDVTFCIPVFYDHPDRSNNLQLNICMLQRLFNADILIGEMGGNIWESLKGGNVNYITFDTVGNFHRTKMLNEMFSSVQTSIIFNWDADVICSPLQILKTIEKLRKKELDVAYPYDGRFARVPRQRFATIEKFLDIGILGGEIFRGMRTNDFKSVGGAVAYSKQVFIEGGGENENMISYAPEDIERKERFERLGYKVGRIKGVIYHLDHFISIDSSEKNPYFDSNWAELRKEKLMNDYQLKEYVKSWEWVKNQCQ